MSEPKRIDLQGTMRLCYEDTTLGLQNVFAEGGHVGSNYRSEEFDFCYAQDTYYDSILQAAQKLARAGNKFSLHTYVSTDGIFHESFTGNLSYDQGVVTLEFWHLDDKENPVYCQFNASPEGVLDSISLVYGGFISTCHTLTPDDINLKDNTIFVPYSFFNGFGFPSDNPTLHDLVNALAEREEKLHINNLDFLIREAKEKFERIAGSRTAGPNLEELGR